MTDDHDDDDGPDHHTMIERDYDHDQGVFRWRVVCSCGYLGFLRMRPSEAERDERGHLQEHGLAD